MRDCRPNASSLHTVNLCIKKVRSEDFSPYSRRTKVLTTNESYCDRSSGHDITYCMMATHSTVYYYQVEGAIGGKSELFLA
jgi:hypothetical protein